MLRRGLVLASILASALVLPAFGCQATEPVSIGLVMRAPQGLLDMATSVELTVYDASLAKCDTATGHVDKIPAGKGVQKFKLDRTGCPAGTSWCANITLDRNGKTDEFAIVAKANGATIAEGCATQAIDQDPLEVDIKVQRYNPPACCNDGVLQTGEQCEGPQAAMACDGSPGASCAGIAADAVCTCDCRTQEILLSIDDGKQAPQLVDGPAGSKKELALAFAPGNPQIGTTLRSFFTSTDTQAIGGADINVRYLTQDFHPIQKPYALGLQLRMPLLCSQTTGTGIKLKQGSPSVAVASADTTAVVYTSDEASSGRTDVYLAPQGLDGCTDQHMCSKPTDCVTSCNAITQYCDASVRLSTPAMSPPGVLEARVAGGPSGSVLAVWSRSDGVFGRIWKTDGTLVPAQGEITIAASGTHARVAGGPKGWKVAFAGPGGVLLANVSPTGDPSAPQKVNATSDGNQDSPDVATLQDGRAIVVFRNGADISFQRYDASGNAIANDQDKPLNTSQGMLANPVVAAPHDAGTFYAVAWEKQDAADIVARFVDAASGFLFNSVTGQNDEFSATLADQTGTRGGPAIAIGPYVAVGWIDTSSTHQGAFVRRFPLPTQ